MGKPFNFVQAAILKALAEALFHDVDMAIPSSQVVANLQRQFALVKGGKATEIGLSLYLLCLVMHQHADRHRDAAERERPECLAIAERGAEPPRFCH